MLQVMDLMGRVDRLNERVDRATRPRDETSPVVQSLQVEVGELARGLKDLTALPARIRQTDNQLETVRAEFKTLQSRLDSFMNGDRPVVGAVAALRAQSADLSPPGTGIAPPSPTMEMGIHLLEQGQYESARKIFDGLQRSEPSDARVWYFGALAVGLASGDWDDEARHLVEKGLERERAGTPPAAAIDAALVTPPAHKGRALAQLAAPASAQHQPHTVIMTEHAFEPARGGGS